MMAATSESLKGAEDKISGDAGTVGLQPPVEPTRKKTILGRIWDTADLPPAERKLLFKVDASLLIFASLGYFIKNLDQTNVNNAFLSGMKEDLGMYGNELVFASTMWTVGYCIGQIPSNLLLTRISPRYVVPAIEFGWGVATLGTYAIKDVKSLYALRFLVGLFEAGFYPGMHFILGSWYTPAEIGKRAAIFWTAGHIGNMFSGFLQTATYTHLNGVNGLEGWRWLFCIDAIITLPIAVLGYICLPDLPFAAKPSWWLTQDDIDLAQQRMTRIGRAGASKWSKAKVKRLLGSWHTYLLPMIYVIWNNGLIQQPMGYYLKSFNAKPPPVPGRSYSVQQINLLPLPGQAVYIVMALTWAWISDGPLRGRRWPLMYLGALVIGSIALTLRQLPLYDNITAHFALYWLYGVGNGAGPLILTWINEICGADLEKRALLVALGNNFAYVVQAIAPNFIWKTVDFPAARKGFTWVVSLNVVLVFWVTMVLFLLRRDRRKALFQQTDTAAEEDSAASVDEKLVADEEKEPGAALDYRKQ